MSQKIVTVANVVTTVWFGGVALVSEIRPGMLRAILFYLVALFLVGCGTLSVEEPPFEVIREYPQFEVRQYADQLVAETRTTGDQKEAANRGFRILADYIFGNNTSADKIAMTAPVSQSGESDSSTKGSAESSPVSQKIAMTAPVAQLRQEGEADESGSSPDDKNPRETWIIRFTMPGGFNLESLPKPNNAAVQIRELPGRLMAVMTFSGYARIATVGKKRESLLQAVEQAGLVVRDVVELAQYNPPWIPGFLRRNEVMVPLESEN